MRDPLLSLARVTLKSIWTVSDALRRPLTRPAPAAPLSLPPLNPATGEPIGPEALAPLFPMALIMQEVSTERYIEIPDEVRDIYTLWRPTPLYRAHRWEQALDTLMQRSMRRAQAVRERLLAAGIDAARVDAQGVGPLAPVCRQAPCEARIEVVLRQ